MSDHIHISKRALVRPFTDCTDLLERGTTIRITPDGEYSNQAVFSELPPNFDLSCKLAFNAQNAAEKAGVAVEELSMAVVLGVRSVKLSQAIHRFSHAELVKGSALSIETAQIQKLPPGTPFSLELALILKKGRKYSPGSPWMAGHWLGKKLLTFNSAPQGRSFNILPIPAAEFPTRCRVPKETFFFVQCSAEDISADRDTFQRNVTVYIREDCYNALASGGHSPAVEALYDQMQSDIVAQIAGRALQGATEETSSETTVRGSLLKRLKKDTGQTIVALSRMAADEPERFRSVVQAMCKLGPTMARTIFS